MEILRDVETKVLCPYNNAHYILKYRMETHLTKCRVQYTESINFVVCDFNRNHRIPQPELQYHHDNCPDRKPIELAVYTEEEEDDSPYKISSVPVGISAPVDDSWDTCEVAQSYDPNKYCEENTVIRRLDTKSAAQKRDFRIAERHRLNNIEQSTTVKAKNSNTKAGSSKEDIQNLPPTRAFSKLTMESTPEDIQSILNKKLMKPAKAVIPKKK